MRRIKGLLLSVALPLAVACGGDDDDEAPWTVVMDGEAAALLAVWGSGPDDVWVVGGDARDDQGPAVHHWDGSALERLDTGQRSVDLWWVFGFAGGPVYMGGSNGALLEYSGGAFTVMPTPATGTIFGIWGESPDDTWAVGGSIAGGGGGGFAWHYDGETWTPDSSVPSSITDMGTIWKVSGRAADDIWMCGTTGFAAHYTGGELEVEQLPLDASLFSVASDGQRFITVGGDFGGEVFENDGSGWVAASVPDDAASLSGVAASSMASYAVGRDGTVLRRGEDGWDSVDIGGATTEDLHAAFVDSEGGVWIVGGEFDTPITSGGVLLYQGPQTVAP